MLVLSRKKDESVEVTDTETGEMILKLTITEIRGDKVRIGLDADRRYRIMRSEIEVIEDDEDREGIIPVAPPVSAASA